MKIFDPYIRSRTQSDDDLKNLHYFGTDKVVTTAYGGGRFEQAEDLLRFFDVLCGVERRRLKRCGLESRVALGVVPDARPRRAHFEVFQALPALLQRPEVVALGEVGVWQDCKEQWQLFERQVRIALEVGPLPVLVTPPKKLKRTLTYKMMGRLEKWGYPTELVVLNRVDAHLLENVVQSGFCAGFAVGAASSEPRAAGEALATALKAGLSPKKILLSSALRTGGADVLGVPKAIVALQEEGVAEEVIEQLVFKNAEGLFERS